MAVSSNDERYMINGVEIPVYPTSIQASDNLVSKSWNDMYGRFKDIPINLKTKVNWVFEGFVTRAELDKLYGQMIRDHIINTGSRFFEINTDFPGVGFISGTYYIGAPTTFTSKGGGSNGKVEHWTMEIHWIEVDGLVLNSPLTTYENVIEEG